jgi:hypothetical protein
VVTDTDENFYDRADAVIQLANDQLSGISRGKVSASCMYATARFNAWVTACGHGSAEDMAAAKEETLEYFTKQYRAMLEENLNDYIDNFGQYMQPKEA